jgi:hypothetical protein
LVAAWVELRVVIRLDHVLRSLSPSLMAVTSLNRNLTTVSLVSSGGLCMARRLVKVHLDNTTVAGPLRTTLCGYLSADLAMTSNVVEVTCASCIARLRGESTKPRKLRKIASVDLAREIHAELKTVMPAQALSPNAGPPPVLDPGLWSTLCRDHRCRSCVLCEWEVEVERWHAVRPWSENQSGDAQNHEYRFGSLNAALRAYVTHVSVGVSRASAIGATLDRLKRGEERGDRSVCYDSKEVRQTDKIVDVELAIRRAFASYRSPIVPAECVQVLLARTPGVAEEMTSYEDLAVRFATTEGHLRAAVKHGRQAVQDDLQERELIPPPKRSRSSVASETWFADDDELAESA